MLQHISVSSITSVKILQLCYFVTSNLKNNNNNKFFINIKTRNNNLPMALTELPNVFEKMPVVKEAIYW